MNKLLHKMRYLIFSLIFVLSFTLLTSVNLTSENVAQADFAGEVGEWLGSAFDTGGEGLSFTQYEGETVSLSEADFDEALTTSSDARDFIKRIVNFALGFLGFIAVIVVIYGGFLYVTAAGDEEKVGKGKQAIIYAGTGLVIVLGSFAFVNTIILGATGGEDQVGSGRAPIVAGTTGGGFNSSAEQVRRIAIDSFEEYAKVDQIYQKLENIESRAASNSLAVSNFPEKTEILNFLRGARADLLEIQNDLNAFGNAYNSVRELVSGEDGLNEKIDFVQSLDYNNYIYDRAGGPVCDPGDSDGFGEGFERGARGDNNPCIAEGAQFYNSQLYQFVESLPTDFGNGAIFDAELRVAIAAELTERIDENRISLERLHAQISPIIDGAPQGGNNNAFSDIAASYEAMRTGYQSVSGNIASNFQVAGQELRAALENQLDYYQAIQSIVHVKARLTADKVQGNAPLTVMFNALATEDPAGGSIQGENIIWDLAGELTYAELNSKSRTDYPNGTVPSSKPVECVSEINSSTVEDGERVAVIGGTARRCTFKEPGTYTAAIKVASNDPTSFAPGISIITITVLPPTTKINLNVEPSGRDPIEVMRYENNTLLTNKGRVLVTKLEAVDSPLTFNAEGTNAKSYRWSFGDGEIQDFDPANESPTKQYAQTGTYEVILETLSDLDVVDRKSFILEIASLAARIIGPASDGTFINVPVTFDGSQSRSDFGNIRGYEWTISISDDQEDLIPEEIQDLYPVVESGAELSSIQHSFPYPLRYDIQLQVTADSDAGVQTSEPDIIEDFLVVSQEPVAAYTYEVPDPAQPGTFRFDASASFDPDGTNEYLEYEWEIEALESGDYEYVNQTSRNSQIAFVKFNEVGDYNVKLIVRDRGTRADTEESDEVDQNITVDNVLDVAWGNDQVVTGQLNEEGIAEIEFEIISENAIAYEIDFGDGDIETRDMDGSAVVSHNYVDGGRYNVQVTVFDENDDDNSIQRRIFIGGGDTAIAKIEVTVDGVNVLDLSEPIVVNKGDSITFDGSESKNVDGTGRRLEYTWDFGDTGRSSQETATHVYRELSPSDPGFFTVSLRVSDEDEPNKNDTDEIFVRVENAAPKVGSIQALPSNNNPELITPVTVNVQSFGAEDPDGRISQYKWWYYDIDNPDQQLGVQLTNDPAASLVIGTSGVEGDEKTYGFGLEVKDTDNLTSSTADTGLQSPTVTVTNGPNELPVADFTVNATSVFVGDTIIFSSASTDEDGSIVSYIWDVEGDGFFNNEPQTEASLEYQYEKKNLNGYDVRLKVVDDKGGEAISAPLKVYVDSTASEPTPSFTVEAVENSNGLRVRFNNTSLPDLDAGANIVQYIWDFDTEDDSSGDDVPDNDRDSTAENPEKQFTAVGTYLVKLIVIDDNGNEAELIKEVKVPAAQAPVAAFDFETSGSTVIFENNSTADLASGVTIVDYAWDFDIDTDTDGNRNPRDDRDSNLKNPIYEYFEAGEYTVQLIVTDSLGQEAEIRKTFEVSEGTSSSSSLDSEPDQSSSSDQTEGSTNDQSSSNQTQQNNLVANFTTNPSPSSDGAVYLNGNTGYVTFNFAISEGPILNYSFDKNINFDTDGNGIPDDDVDFRRNIPGTWTANFDRSWGPITVRLIVEDIYGNKSTKLQEIKFN